MGYYSDVCLVLNWKAAKKLNELLEERKNTPENDLFNNFADDYAVYQKNGEELYYWHNIEWNEEFPEVVFATEFMESLPPEDFYFVRVGDALDDAVQQAGEYLNSYFSVSVVRKIKYE